VEEIEHPYRRLILDGGGGCKLSRGVDEWIDKLLGVLGRRSDLRPVFQDVTCDVASTQPTKQPPLSPLNELNSHTKIISLEETWESG
jgi:hypothetical protein